MFRLQDQPARLHVYASGSNHQEADYYDLYVFDGKLSRLEQIRQLSRLCGSFIWDSDKSVSLPVQRKAALIQS